MSEQASEEEQKAIKTAKCIRAGVPVQTCDDDYIVLLNIIEKQQKEIEEMREELQMYVDVQNNDIHNYISKDKIKEKIKKAKEINWHTPKLVIEYFEELLEENTNE